MLKRTLQSTHELNLVCYKLHLLDVNEIVQWVCKKEDLAAMCTEDQNTFIENLKQLLESEVQAKFDLGTIKAGGQEHDLRNVITNF